MGPTSIRLDSSTQKMLDDYCAENGCKMSEALRQLVRDSLERHNRKNEIGFIDSIGPEGLMVNEKRAIRAAIESLYLLRKLVKDKDILEKITEQTDEILKQGWLYDNK